MHKRKVPIEVRHHVRVLSRVALLAAAIVACAWFALSVRQATDTARAGAIIASGTPLSAGQAARADSLLAAAGTLNPDSQVDLLRAEVALGRGERNLALRIVLGVTRREPDNALGWLWLERTATNLKTFYVGAYHLLILAPKVR